MASIKVGNVEIISLLDVRLALPLSMTFPSVPPESWSAYRELYPDAFGDGTMVTNFQAFAVRSGGRTLLVDMGAGPGPHEIAGGAVGSMTAEMKAQGVDPDYVDMVLFTHLHFDHTGWAIVDGEPLCPSARYLAPAADWPLLGKTEYGFPPADALQSLHQSGRVNLVSGEVAVTPEVTLLPTPGHTPGHQSVVISSAGERAMIVGDVAGTPALVEETGWSFVFDADPPAAIETRKRVMERLEREDGLAAFGHFPAPGFGRILRDGGRRVFRAL